MADDFSQHTVTNSGKAPRGIYTRDGMVTINPGETRDVMLTKQIADEEKAVDGVEFAKAAKAAKAADPLDHDGDGKKGGAAPAKD